MGRKAREMGSSKTNALRLLEQAGVSYETHAYALGDAHLSAQQVAQRLQLAPGALFKTLLARGDRNGPLFAVVPGDRELDLKALARASGDRRAALVPLAEVTELTGYVRGGTTVLGARKALPAFLDASAQTLERITVSAGKRGLQVSLSPGDYLAVTGAKLAPLTGVPAAQSTW